MGDGKRRGPMDLIAVALEIVGAESSSQGSTSPGKTSDVIPLFDEDAEAVDSDSYCSLSDRGIAMLNAPKMSRRKVKAGSAPSQAASPKPGAHKPAARPQCQ